jgi:HAE1 family hydrophobic/amphiphilic exporter-1
VSRRILGTVVIVGMLAATLIAVFLIPVLFVVVERTANRKGKVHVAPGPEEGIMDEES